MSAAQEKTVEVLGRSQRTFALHVDAQKLVALLNGLEPGEERGYGVLAAALGLDPVRHRAVLLVRVRAAARALHREYGIVLGVVNGQGVRRLSDPEIVALGSRTLAHTRRVAGRTRRKMACVDYEALSPQDKTTHQMGLTLLGITETISTAKSQAKVARQVERAQSVLSLSETLEAFKT